ncbi:hypothetical protein ABG067_004113 [Albugo candida]
MPNQRESSKITKIQLGNTVNSTPIRMQGVPPTPSTCIQSSVTRVNIAKTPFSIIPSEDVTNTVTTRPCIRGTVRYLKPKEVATNQLPAYEFAIILHRQAPQPNCWKRFMHSTCSPCGCCSNSAGFGRIDESTTATSTRRARQSWFGCTGRDAYRLCFPSLNSDRFEDNNGEHVRIIEELCRVGLNVDIVDGGHSKEEIHSDFLILLLYTSRDVVEKCVQSLRHHSWFEHGDIADFLQDIQDQSRNPPTPAERIQIAAYLIEQEAKSITRGTNPWIHDMFPVHDPVMSQRLITNWVTPWSIFGCRRENVESKIMSHVRDHFGEKVAYYFAFLDFYQLALLPLAVIGLLYSFTLNTDIISMELYMRVLPFWGFFVSVVWSFLFLKLWDRQNTRVQYQWNGKVHSKEIEYPNKNYYGIAQMNSLTGEMEYQYPAWRRYPKYLCVVVFVVLQIMIMMVLVASWITIYEILKVKYKESHIFSTQWFLVLLEGIVFGLFVDVIQWNMIVTRMGHIFTRWENYKTEEQYEKALIAKLFLLDFLNYYTWFFSLAFVFVIPGVGDYIMNGLNRLFFGDAMNCCFGPYVDQNGQCINCPVGPKDAHCVECVGFFTFDRHHVDLSAMFVTPIVVTESLNLAIGVIGPLLSKWRRERARAAADARSHERVVEAGSLKIIGSLDYNHDQHGNAGSTQVDNKLHARYLEYTQQEIGILNRKGRQLLFESEQDTYDPYNDFHMLTVQFGFTVMFSILWPLMPFACFLVNCVKRRIDAYRLCKTLKRPIPRKANGIGPWRSILTVFACTAVLVNVLLICISTGSIEFYSELCVRDIKHQLAKRGKNMADFVMGPNFGCLHLEWRFLIIFILEHVFMAIAYLIVTRYSGIPDSLQVLIRARENRLKKLLKERENLLFSHETVDDQRGSFVGSSPPPSQSESADEPVVKGGTSILSQAGNIVLGDGSGLSRRNTTIPRGFESQQVKTDGDEVEPLWLDAPSSDGHRSRAREKLAMEWAQDEGSTV